MPAGRSVNQEPEDDPGQTQTGADDKGPAPSQAERDQRHHRRRQPGSDRRSGIENPDCQGPLAHREPFAHGFDRGREIGRFGGAEQEPAKRELAGGLGEGVRQVGARPGTDGDGETAPRPEAVDQPPAHRVHDGVADKEGGGDVRVLQGIDPHFPLQSRSKQGQDLPVQVIEGSRQAEQAGDIPAQPFDFFPPRRGQGG